MWQPIGSDMLNILVTYVCYLLCLVFLAVPLYSMDGLASRSLPKTSFLQRFFFGTDMQLPNLALDAQYLIASWMPNALFYPLVLKPDKILEGHEDPIWHVSFSNDGNYIVTKSKTELCLWDRIQGRLIKKLKSEHLRGDALLEMGAFDPTTKIFAVSSNKGLKLFDIETWTEKNEQTPINWSFDEIWFSCDGKIIGSCRGNCTFIYDPVTKKVETIIWGGDNCSFNAFNMTHDGRHLVGDKITSGLFIYNLSNKELTRLPKTCRGCDVKVNNDLTKGLATTVLCFGSEYPVLLRLKPEISLEQTLTAHRRLLTCTGISPQGTIIISGSRDAKGRIWETETGKCIAILPCGISGEIRGSLSPLGNCVALGCQARLYLFTCTEVEKNFTNFLRKRVNLQQLLAIKFFDLMRQLGSDKLALVKQLVLTESDVEELRQVFYSFKDKAVRRYLNTKYRLPWPPEAN